MGQFPALPFSRISSFTERCLALAHLDPHMKGTKYAKIEFFNTTTLEKQAPFRPSTTKIYSNSFWILTFYLFHDPTKKNPPKYHPSNHTTYTTHHNHHQSPGTALWVEERFTTRAEVWSCGRASVFSSSCFSEDSWNQLRFDGWVDGLQLVLKKMWLVKERMDEKKWWEFMRFLCLLGSFFLAKLWIWEFFYRAKKNRGGFHARFSDNQSPSHTEAIVVGGWTNPLDKYMILKMGENLPEKIGVKMSKNHVHTTS